MSDTFTKHTIESAPQEAKAHLERAREQFGFVPGPVAKMANAPPLLDAFLKVNPIFEKTTFSPLEREVLIMVLSAYNGCDYCMAMHTAIMKRAQAPEPVVAALREGRPIEDGRLQALAEFTRRVLETRGRAGDAALQAFFGAGYTHRQALEVVLGIAVYTMTTYANRLTEVELDAAFEPFRWQPPASVRGEG